MAKRALLDSKNAVVSRVKILSAADAVAEFKKHERRWKRDTQYTSSLSEKYLHASYARIIGLGWAAVPLILSSLEREPDDWFYALRAITGADPVRTAHAGVMPKMSEVWINWGRHHGLI
jgi:hypothetical protein